MLDKYVLLKDSLIDKRSRFVVKEISKIYFGITNLPLTAIIANIEEGNGIVE